MAVSFRTSDMGRYPGFEAAIYCIAPENTPANCVSPTASPSRNRRRRFAEVSCNFHLKSTADHFTMIMY